MSKKEKQIDLVPLQDNVIVEPIETENTTKSGIILTTKKDEKPGIGLVIAVWEGKILENGKRSAMDVCVWDVVYFTKYAPDEIEIDVDGIKRKYLVIKQTSILARQGEAQSCCGWHWYCGK